MTPPRTDSRSFWSAHDESLPDECTPVKGERVCYMIHTRDNNVFLELEMHSPTSVSLTPSMLLSLIFALPTISTRSSTIRSYRHIYRQETHRHYINLQAHHIAIQAPHLVVHVYLVEHQSVVDHSPRPQTREANVWRQVSSWKALSQGRQQGSFGST